MSRFFVLFFFFIYSINVSGQIFSWCDDGYVEYSGGGTFLDIDGSGIDLVVTGMEYDNCLVDSIMTPGINDQFMTSVVHNYGFSFSEPVDVGFKISNINQNDSLEPGCWEDYLILTGAPVLSNSVDISINGDTITPTSSSGIASVLVRYNGVTSFTITHGNGIGCNPGYIWIHRLIINDNQIVGIDEPSPLKIIRLVNRMLLIEAKTTLDRVVLYDLQGKQILSFDNIGENQVTLNLGNLSSGIYLIVAHDTDDRRYVEKLVTE